MNKPFLIVGFCWLSLAVFKAPAFAAPKKPFPKAAVVAAPTPTPTPLMPAFQPGNRILFQGDSITDGNRGRSDDPNHILGHGYAFIIAAKYGEELAERNLTFINRGISGNKVSDLAGRWQNDTLNLKPDLLSILVGVNDASANIPIEQFESTYDKMLQDTVTALPNVKLLLCQPFTLPGDKHAGDWESWKANIQSRQDAVARLATKYGAALVHFQKVFDDATKRAPADHWIWDTVHPTYSGHQLLADEWVKTVSAFKFEAHPKVPLMANSVADSVNSSTNTRPLNSSASRTPTPGLSPGALSFVSAQTSDNKNPIVLGWRFTTGANDVAVSSLGYFNDGANATHAVGIFDANTKTLVSPAVKVTTVGGALSGENASFTYVTLPQPIRLTAGTPYILAATTKSTGWLERIKDIQVGYGIRLDSLHCAFKFGPEELDFPDSTFAANDPALLGPNFLGAILH